MTQDSLNPTPSAEPAEPEDDVIEVMARAAIDAAVATHNLRVLGGAITEAQARASRRSILEATVDWPVVMRAALSASGLLERERVLREALEPFLAIAEVLANIPPETAKRVVDRFSVITNSGMREGRRFHEYARLTTADFYRVRTALSNPLKAD